MTDGRKAPTLAARLAEWMARRRDQLRPHTRVHDAGIVRNDVVPHLGERRLDELDRRLLERTYAHLLPAMDRDAADTFAEILREGDE